MPEFLAVPSRDPVSVRPGPRESRSHRSCRSYRPAPASPPPTGGRLRQDAGKRAGPRPSGSCRSSCCSLRGRGRERADLNQVAYLGLVKAARRFDRTKGDSFPAYAAPTITGELKRYSGTAAGWSGPRGTSRTSAPVFSAPNRNWPSPRGESHHRRTRQKPWGRDGPRPGSHHAASSLHPDSFDAVNPRMVAAGTEVLASPDCPLSGGGTVLPPRGPDDRPTQGTDVPAVLRETRCSLASASECPRCRCRAGWLAPGGLQRRAP